MCNRILDERGQNESDIFMACNGIMREHRRREREGEESESERVRESESVRERESDRD